MEAHFFKPFPKIIPNSILIGMFFPEKVPVSGIIEKLIYGNDTN